MNGTGWCLRRAASRCLEQIMGQTSNATSLRLFIALPIPDRVKDEIERVQDELRAILPKQCVRMTKREQFHLTLRFLGNVEARRAKELVEQVETACRGFSTLKLKAERIGCFPDLRFPRVVWVWVHDDAERLQALQKVVEMAASPFAEKKEEKDFTGHATIARLNGINRPQAEVLAKFAHGMSNRLFGEWIGNEVNVIHSELWPDGSRYTTLAAIPLAGKETTNEHSST